MQENEHKTDDAPLKKLASAQDLRGRKSGTGAAGTGKKRKLWLSLLALVVVLGIAVGIFFASGIFKPAEEPEEESTYVSETVKLISNTRKNVASVTIDLAEEAPYTIVCNTQYDEEGNAIKLPDDTKAYVIEGLEEFDLNQSTAESITSYAANLTATKLITDKAESMAEYGLDAPRSEVTMTYRDGKSTTWLIGNKAPTSTASYFCEKGTKAVFLLYSSAVNNLTSTRNSLHNVTMPWTIDSANIKDLLIEAEGRETIELGFAETTENNIGISTLRILQPFYYSAHSDRADKMFAGAAGLTISGYAGELGELENTGLEDGGAIVKITSTVTVDDVTSTYVYRLGGYASADQRYVQIDDTNAVYLTDTSNVEFLDNATPEYLVDTFANLVFIDRVESIDVNTADDAWNIAITREEVEGKKKPVDHFFFDGEEADEKLSRKLYQVIIGTMFSKLSDNYHFEGDVYCTVKYTLNVEPGEIVVEYLDYDDNYLAIRRDGQTLFLIKRENVNAMITALQQFREGTFAPES